MKAEEFIKAGDLATALSELQDAVRNNPAKPEYRTFLFQLLCVMGDWSRALTQLNVVADMDSSTLLMAQTYRELLLCEAFRAEVFTGNREPLIFGEPNSWTASLVQALGSSNKGNGQESHDSVMVAMDQVEAHAGTIDDQPFEWLSDADMRLGPVFEIILNGKYYWVPMSNIAQISFSAPEDLRDLVWLPVQIEWVNEGKSIGFMPTRYPGAATLADNHNALARKTEWIDIGAEFFIGAGQRMFATDAGDMSLLQAKKIVFENVEQTLETVASEG